MSKKNNWYDDFDWDGATETITKKLSEALRPAIDEAIKNRQQSYNTTKAEIDVDAASRGMEASSFVSSMKEREAQSRDSDISGLEADYQSTLASNLYSSLMSLYETHTDRKIAEEQMALEREKMYQQRRIAEQELAFKRQQLAAQKKAAEQASASSGMPKMGYDYSSYYTYLKMLPVANRFDLFNSDDVYWNWARTQMKNDLGAEQYNMLYHQFMTEYYGDANRYNGYGNPGERTE